MPKMIRYGGPEKLVYIFDDGRIHTPSQILDNDNLFQFYRKSLVVEVYEDWLDGVKFDNALEIIFNPEVKEKYPDLFPEAFNDAFEKIWAEGRLVRGHE